MTYIYHEKNQKKRFYIEQIYGDCLAKVRVRNVGGGYAIIDHNAKAKVGDLVHCARNCENISSYIKQVKRIEGDTYIVGTAYLDESKDFEFEASNIYGVVIETYGKAFGFRDYVRPTHLRKKNKKGADNEREITDK